MWSPSATTSAPARAPVGHLDTADWGVCCDCGSEVPSDPESQGRKCNVCFVLMASRP
ncbi:rCG24722 [Rattus norvegicus]|uniref:RCG24722 n=1 Tax=Rattus norvegicus TaxID=10116 RepID=A6JCC3_RAT|nr:rCG24722 [Rattus norvegicus]